MPEGGNRRVRGHTVQSAALLAEPQVTGAISTIEIVLESPPPARFLEKCTPLAFPRSRQSRVLPPYVLLLSASRP